MRPLKSTPSGVDDIKFKTLHKFCHNAVSNTDKNLLITYPGPESKSYYLNSEFFEPFCFDLINVLT